MKKRTLILAFALGMTALAGAQTNNGGITAEMLEKNGWSNDGMYARLRIDEHLHLEYYYHEHRLLKYFCGVDEWQNHAKVADITFAAHCYSVHQLQHALRLAGVDKELNL